MGRSPVRHGDDAGEEQVLALVREHAGELLRLARRFSICADDAQDAYQRTLEKLVRRMRHEPPENTLKWVRTVLRNEALAIRNEREQLLGRLALDDDRQRDEDALDPADRVERFERLAHTAEALRGLKPQEMTALALRAEGLSYKEICARTGWTYTRTNRTVNEGRRALLSRLSAIESGAECERWLPLLSLLADGEATARELSELRPHLRSCTACRATLRGFHAAPGQVAALLPAAGLPALAGAGAGAAAGGGLGVGRHLEALLQSFAERANTTVLRFHSVIDTVPSGKLAAVAASTVAVAGGGAAIKQADGAGTRPPAAVVVASPAPDSSSPTLTTASISAPLTTTPQPSPTGPASPAASGPVAVFSATSGLPPTTPALTTAPFAEFALEPLAGPAAGAGEAAGAGSQAGEGPAASGGWAAGAGQSAGATFPGTASAPGPSSEAVADLAQARPSTTARAGQPRRGRRAGGAAASDDEAKRGSRSSRRDNASEANHSSEAAPTLPGTRQTTPSATSGAATADPEFTPAATRPSEPAFSNPQPAAPRGAEFP